MNDTWKILVVDDDADIITITEMALRRRSWRNQGFELTSAKSAREAVDLLKQYGASYHVAIVDVVMETETAGLELCRYIRSNFPTSLRIILRTGQPGIAPEEHILNTLDIDHYLAKGEATTERLFALVRACLRTAEDVVALEDTNAQLTVSNTKLHRESQFRSWVMSKLGETGSGLLDQLDSNAGLLGEAESPELKRAAASIRDLTSRAHAVLRPMDIDGRFRAMLRNKSILVMQKAGRGLSFTRGALAGLAATTTIAESWEDASLALRGGQTDLLLLDYDNLGLLNEGIKYNPGVVAVLMTTQEVFEKHGPEIMSLPIASAVIINALADTFAGASHLEPLVVIELVVTLGKLLSGDIFGLEKYLVWGIQVNEVSLTHSKQRSEILDLITDFSRECQVRSQIRDKIVLLADELLMNAIWDAPVDRSGRAKYHGLPRNQPVALDPSEAVTFRYATDGNIIAVSVADQFGRLHRETACRYLLQCLARSSSGLGPQVDGEGLGLALAFQSISSFIINCAPGTKTEVVGLVNLRMGARERATRPRSFHYFTDTHTRSGVRRGGV